MKKATSEEKRLLREYCQITKGGNYASLLADFEKEQTQHRDSLIAGIKRLKQKYNV